MYSKRIIFLDVSGSSLNGELWITELAMLEATLRVDKYLDTYVCAFSDDCKLLTSQELDKVKAQKDIGISFAGTSAKSIENYFPSEIGFWHNAKVIIISDMFFADIDSKQLKNNLEKLGAKDVFLFEINESMSEFYRTAKALESSKEEEKTQKKFEPTFKGKPY